MLDASTTHAGRLAAALDDLIGSSPDVEAAAVVSRDGLPLASALPAGFEEDHVSALSAVLLSLGEQAASALGRGQLNQVFVEGEHGFVFLMGARDQAVLAVVARRTVTIGSMLFAMRRVADRIGSSLEVAMTPADEGPDASAPDAAAAMPSPAPETLAVAGVTGDADQAAVAPSIGRLATVPPLEGPDLDALQRQPAVVAASEVPDVAARFEDSDVAAALEDIGIVAAFEHRRAAEPPGASAASPGAPAASFGAPAASFGASATSFGASATSFGASATSFGASAASFGASAASPGAPAVPIDGPAASGPTDDHHRAVPAYAPAVWSS